MFSSEPKRAFLILLAVSYSGVSVVCGAPVKPGVQALVSAKPPVTVSYSNSLVQVDTNTYECIKHAATLPPAGPGSLDGNHNSPAGAKKPPTLSVSYLVFIMLINAPTRRHDYVEQHPAYHTTAIPGVPQSPGPPEFEVDLTKLKAQHCPAEVGPPSASSKVEAVPTTGAHNMTGSTSLRPRGARHHPDPTKPDGIWLYLAIPLDQLGSYSPPGAPLPDFQMRKRKQWKVKLTLPQMRDPSKRHPSDFSPDGAFFARY